MTGLAAYLASGIVFASALAASEAEQVMLPSGLKTHLQEMLWDRPGGGLVYRFRFVAPEFSTEKLDYDLLSSDLEHLCNEFALPRLSNVGPEPGQVIISLADRESEFGVIDPDLNQVFEAYSVENGACIWEVF
ncbi:DUF6497 family protein [Roseovarius aestuarii]|uniref:Acetolactate synthase n=1 Tax=Roseovarius aestuarii TaxID=475083 RepID=A0A1X7BTK7_9RHOB|nr:DUF6497 family protein [Roseovarius aestuarii]SMC12559.1 hypothetical protein ROA7745_02387 [Roseovarius aestuarii]